MARRAVALLLAVALAAVLLHPAAAAAGQKKPAIAVRREDITYIECQAWERIAREISAQVTKKQQDLPPSKKVQVPSNEIIDIAKNVCNLKKQELVEQDEGHCNEECKTIERACHEVMEYDTDVAPFVYKDKPSIDQLMKFLWKDLSEACAKGTPKVPKDPFPGEPFAAKPSKDAEMEKVHRSMEGTPDDQRMKVNSGDDLMKNNFDTEDDNDSDEDEDDDNAKNLRKTQKVMLWFKDAGKKVKGCINMVPKMVIKAPKKIWHWMKKPAESGKSKTEL